MLNPLRITGRDNDRVILLGVLILLSAVAPLSAAGQTRTVRVLYFTPRNLIDGTRSNQLDYGTELAPPSCGTATVSVPPNHRIGALERPNPIRWEFFEDEEHHVVVTGVTEIDRRQFKQSLAKAVEQGSTQELLIVVHGHSTQFAESLRQAAQLACDLQFQGTMVVFTWPTQGTVSAESYQNDKLSVSASVSAMQELFGIVRESVPHSQIHVLAHSLGCHLVASAAVAPTTTRMQMAKPWLDQVVLAAADIDAGSFARVIWPSLKQAARNVTAYCSTADMALSLSKQWSFGTDPLGLGVSPLIARMQGITVIDTTFLKGSPLSFGHCYHRESPAVINDIRLVLDGAAPEQRGLKFHKPDENSAGRWSFATPQTLPGNQP